MRDAERYWSWDESQILLAPNHRTHLNTVSSAQGPWLKGRLGCIQLPICSPALRPATGSAQVKMHLVLSLRNVLSDHQARPHGAASLVLIHIQPGMNLQSPCLGLQCLWKSFPEVPDKSLKTPRDGPAGSLCSEAHSWGVCVFTPFAPKAEQTAEIKPEEKLSQDSGGKLKKATWRKQTLKNDLSVSSQMREYHLHEMRTRRYKKKKKE